MAGAKEEAAGAQTKIELIPTPQGNDDIHEFDENEGYLVDTAAVGQKDLRLAADGHTVLVPQPSDDPHDPLNWSPVRKNTLLAIIGATNLIADYSSATGAPELFPQAM